MKSILEIINGFDIDQKKYETAIPKFLGSLSLTLDDDFKEKKNLLQDKGILIKKPSQFKIFYNTKEYLKNKIEEFERIGELQLLQKNPLLINSKTLIDRITDCITNFQNYKNEKGNLENNVRWASLFKPISTPKIEKNETSEDISIKESEEYNLNQIDPTDLIVSDKNETNNVDKTLSSNDASLEINPLDGNDYIPFTDETFAKYNELLEKTRRIIMQVYSRDEVPERIIDNLAKCVKKLDISDNKNDKYIIYYAITKSLTISEEDKKYIENAIDEELNFKDTSVELGRVA